MLLQGVSCQKIASEAMSDRDQEAAVTGVRYGEAYMLGVLSLEWQF